MFKGFFKPTRQALQVENEPKIILDLDALLPQPVGFILHGDKHVVKPVSVEHFAKIYQAIARIDDQVKSQKLKGDSLYKAYAEAFKTVCPTMTAGVISRMTKQQIDAFFLFIMKLLSGEAFTMEDLKAPETGDGEKKK